MISKNEIEIPSDRPTGAMENAVYAPSTLNQMQETIDSSDATIDGARFRKSQRKRSARESTVPDDWKEFRRTTAELFAMASELKDVSDAGENPNDRADLITNIESILDQLMDISFGKKECLARCVAAIEAVVLRAEWTSIHASFVEDVSSFLKSRSYVDDSTVNHVYQIIAQHNLDEFRGVMSL